ncbi:MULTISPECIES: polysaccharide deacetylase family protein [unclassified Thioalkalivibrio]|uniref:polysaccharide deacetylase family protein n=1 Tax=unclassified Thioalkalivibrio TaxID=2621013 RepID=UPI00035FAF27|nr:MULTISPECIES: polysaccharide deacetylase family protein [unclassified Thioalkalivibrio]
MLRVPLSMLSPQGRRARLTILAYHRVLADPDPLRPEDPVAETFRWQMRLLAREMNPLPLDEAIERLQEGRLPARAVAVTFDDGYADNAEIALPILREEGVPATFFVATGYLNGGCMFNDMLIETVRRIPSMAVDLAPEGLGTRPLESMAQRRATIHALIGALKYRPLAERSRRAEALGARFHIMPPGDLMMTDDQVRELANAGMGIGGHTVLHPILAETDAETAQQEIAEGKAELEALVGRPVRLFAYPNGRPGKDYAPEHVEMVRASGFDAAVSTMAGAAGRDTDPLQLPRFTPWDRTPLRFGLRLARNLASAH